MNKNYQVIQIKWPFDSPVFFTVTLVSPSPTVSTPDVSTPVSGTSVGRITRLICLDLESRPQINWKCHRKRRAIFGVLDKEYDWTILLDWFQWSWALSGAFFTSFFLSWVFFEILNFQLFVELPNFECTNFKNSEIYEITNMRNGRFQPSSQKIHLFISTKKTHMAVFFKGFYSLKTAFSFRKTWGAAPWSPQLRWKTTMHAHNLIFNNLNVFCKVWCDLWNFQLVVEPTHPFEKYAKLLARQIGFHYPQG